MTNRDLRKSDVAAALTRAMKRRRISQIELAARADVTQSYISQICTGRKMPTIETLERICGAIGLSLGELIRMPEEDGMRKEADRALTEEETYLVDCYRAMNQQNKSVLFGLVDLLNNDVRLEDSGSSDENHFSGDASAGEKG